MIVSLYLLFEVLAVVCCLHYLYGRKVQYNVITLAFVIMEMLWMLLIHSFGLNHSFTFVMYLGMLIYCGLNFGLSIKNILINNILCIIFVGTIQASFMLGLSMILGTSVIGQLESMIVNCFTFIFVTLILKRYKLVKVSKILQKKEILIIATLIISLISIIIFIRNYRYDNGLNIAYYILLLVGLGLIIVSVIDIGKHKIKTREIEAELRLHKLYEKSFQNLIDDICSRQHEFDNHINAVYSQHFLCSSYEELVNVQRKYCADVLSDNNYNKLLSKGNPTILGFLYGKFVEAEKKGIDISYNISIEELKSNVPIYKLVEILGNLLNNAIEELEKEGNNALYICMIEGTEKIDIKIGNKCNKIDYAEIEKLFTKGYSKKGLNRGIGLYNVKKICVEYNIDLKCFLEEADSGKWLYFELIINKAP